ncbi:MAG: hypothetical protein HC927_10345, partial [Deltaproteobacteria bacterium]|nr:hypothetical protein [Deltaproteobacteria bacterium]
IRSPEPSAAADSRSSPRASPGPIEPEPPLPDDELGDLDLLPHDASLYGRLGRLSHPALVDVQLLPHGPATRMRTEP